MMRHAPYENVAYGIEVGAAVVANDPLGFPGGSGCVIERERLPFVGGPRPAPLRIAFREQVLVFLLAKQAAAVELRIDHIDHHGRIVQEGNRLGHGRRKFPVRDQQPRLAMAEHEGNRLGVQAGVQCVEHRAAHRHAEMRLIHRRGVRQHHGNRVAYADAPAGEGRGEAATARIGFTPGLAVSGMH